MATTPSSQLIGRFFNAMMQGESAAAEMSSLFAEDAIYVEPFSGKAKSHTGRSKILRAMQQGWKSPLPDMRITVDQVEADDFGVKAAWTCRSPALPKGAASGVNIFLLDKTKINRLETHLAHHLDEHEAKISRYLASLPRDQQKLATDLRKFILGASPAVIEKWKWAEPVYEFVGPMCWIKAQKAHVTFGFWRGAELMKREPRLFTSGSKMAHMKLTKSYDIDKLAVVKLVRAAMELNLRLGDPTK